MLTHLTWSLHPVVVIRVDTHFIFLSVEGKLAGVDGPQFMVILKVRPAP